VTSLPIETANNIKTRQERKETKKQALPRKWLSGAVDLGRSRSEGKNAHSLVDERDITLSSKRKGSAPRKKKREERFRSRVICEGFSTSADTVVGDKNLDKTTTHKTTK